MAWHEASLSELATSSPPIVRDYDDSANNDSTAAGSNLSNICPGKDLGAYSASKFPVAPAAVR